MSILKIRVLLDDAEIEAYRDIEIESTDHFESLHDQIIKAYGLRGDEMSSFYESDEDWDKKDEIPLMAMEDGEVAMRDTVLSSKADKKGSRFFYIYNFLTLWIFYVEVMAVQEKEADVEYPRTVKKYGPNINEDVRDEDSIIPEMESEIIKKSSKVIPDYEDAFEFEGSGDYGDIDPLDGEYEDIDDLDI